jgi:hypothetical protein
MAAEVLFFNPFVTLARTTAGGAEMLFGSFPLK